MLHAFAQVSAIIQFMIKILTFASMKGMAGISVKGENLGVACEMIVAWIKEREEWENSRQTQDKLSKDSTGLPDGSGVVAERKGRNQNLQQLIIAR